MRITPKIVDEAVAQSAGEDVLPLLKFLKKRKNVSEFKLAEWIKKEVNVTRNLLYKLYNINLVSFERIKDQKKGWYIYYWTFNVKKVKDLIKHQKKEKKERIKEMLKKEENNIFYSCEENCLRVEFGQAFDFEFKCPECGKLLEEQNNDKKIKKLKSDLIDLEKEIEKQKNEANKIIKKEEVEKKKIIKKTTNTKKKILKKKIIKKKQVKKKTTTKKTTKKKKTIKRK